MGRGSFPWYCFAALWATMSNVSRVRDSGLGLKMDCLRRTDYGWGGCVCPYLRAKTDTCCKKERGDGKGLLYLQVTWTGERKLIPKGTLGYWVSGKGTCGTKKKGDGNGLLYLQVTWIGERKLQFEGNSCIFDLRGQKRGRSTSILRGSIHNILILRHQVPRDHLFT